MSGKFLPMLLTIPVFWSPWPPLAQQPQNNPPGGTGQNKEETIKVRTTAVQFEAIVTDRTGRPVKGLTALDFRVLDEGTPKQIDYFSVVAVA